MGIEFKISDRSIRNFQSALREYEKATKKEAEEVLNRATRNVLMRSIQFTRKTTKGSVRRDSNPKRSKLLWKLAATKGHRRGRGIGAEVDRMYQQRLNSTGYIAAGFLTSLRTFQAGYRGRSNAQLKPGGDAARGKATKAKASRLKTTFENFADGADTIAGPAVERAINYVAEDMQRYAARKFQQVANKYSA